MRVGIGSDHGGFFLSEQVAEQLRGAGYEIRPDPSNEVIATFAHASVNIAVLQSQRLAQGVASFAKSSADLLACIASKSGNLKAE
jgi:ribose 5-phosphate isomerase RpiB